jgi:hypothetical protein
MSYQLWLSAQANWSGRALRPGMASTRLAPGANLGATRANDFPRQANGCGQAGSHDPSPRTDPDDPERRTGIYGSEGWGFESLRARH